MAYATAQYDFAGSVAVVTGGASGIGAEVARQLQASGATVVAWDLSAPDHTGAALRVDVTDRAGVERAAQQTVARWGQIDFLVNSAGFAGPTVPLDAYDPDAWTRIVEVNLVGVMADQRVKGFEKVPTLKERNIDLSIGTWRGIAAPKNTPPEVVAYLKSVTVKVANEPAFREVLEKQNLGFAYADEAAFKANMAKDSAYFKTLMAKLNIKN